MEKTEKYAPELPRELLGRMCVDGERDIPEELFDLVSTLEGDREEIPAADALSAGELREDAVRDGCAGECLSGRTENGFAVTCYRLTSDDKG